MERKLTPSIMRLVSLKVASEAIPTGGNMQNGIAFLGDKERMIKVTKDAVKWAFAAVDVVKTSPDNPYGDDDEAIAAAIVAEYEG